MSAAGTVLKSAFLVLAAGTLVSAHSLSGQQDAAFDDWSTRDLAWTSDVGKWEDTQAICVQVRGIDPPIEDLPTHEQRAEMASCNSEDLYFGIGQSADHDGARRCAYLETEQATDSTREIGLGPFDYFRAHGTLAIIYANGKGARRDLDLALKHACLIDDAPAAMDARIRHLDRLRRDGPGEADFHICDDVTSGIAGGVCAGHSARIQENARTSRIAQWQSDWNQHERALFEAAFDSFEAYALVSHELDCMGGTLANACMIDGQQRDIELFLQRLEHLVAGKPVVPLASADMENHREPEFARPATMTGAAFARVLEFADESQRARLEHNLAEAIRLRRDFEPKLIAFTKAVRPDLCAHEIRVLFRDL